MTTVFHGDVLLPGETGSGLAASLQVEDELVTLASGSEVLATWQPDDAVVEDSGDGAYRLNVEGDYVFFRPDSPLAFAKAMNRTQPGRRVAVEEEPAAPPRPAPAPVAVAPQPMPERVQPSAPAPSSNDDDAVIDEVIAKLPPVGARAAGDDDFISAGFVKVVGVVAAVIIVAAVLALLFL